MDKIISAIAELKALVRKTILRNSATFHAIDVMEKIAGWEAASLLGDTSFDLYKKVKSIFQEEVDKLTDKSKG